MKKQVLGLLACGLMITTSCQNAANKQPSADEISKEAIAVHDEIMPQISVFDKHTIVIDSLLSNLAAVKQTNSNIDTAATRKDLNQLKADLESANDKMMTWMKDYDPSNADTAYQRTELDYISKLKTEFETVTKTADAILPALAK